MFFLSKFKIGTKFGFGLHSKAVLTSERFAPLARITNGEIVQKVCIFWAVSHLGCVVL